MNIRTIQKLSKINNKQINTISIKIENNLVKNEKKYSIIPDNITARWEGFPMPKQQNLLDGDDVGTLLTSQLEGDEEGKAPLTCTQKIIKYIKILVPHIVLVAVLIGYLCLGASILQALETRTELVARSRKLVRLNNMIENFTIESWKIFGSNKTINNPENWAIVFRDYMVKVAQEVDERQETCFNNLLESSKNFKNQKKFFRRPIQQELLAPERLDNIHNKWTFPTALLYVLTVLTTCGYSEVSVNTDVGKIFSVIFALVGIPLMFITAADIGKFLSDTLLRIIAEWKLMTRRVKRIAYDLFYAQKSGKLRRKSLQSISVSLGALELADIGCAYVLCICVYCSFGSIMFMNWEEKWSFIHSFHFGFNLIVTVGSVLDI
uniref:Potassium channel domain-containing protein n=1 Tax=Meloidogyne incognita TaxID=6306 RepID=A0A914LV14_MELIC